MRGALPGTVKTTDPHIVSPWVWAIAVERIEIKVKNSWKIEAILVERQTSKPD